MGLGGWRHVGGSRLVGGSLKDENRANFLLTTLSARQARRSSAGAVLLETDLHPTREIRRSVIIA